MQRFIICLKSALHNYLKLLEQIIFQCYNKVTKRYRLVVRTADSHSVDTGSIPVAAEKTGLLACFFNLRELDNN